MVFSHFLLNIMDFCHQLKEVTNKKTPCISFISYPPTQTIVISSNNTSQVTGLLDIELLPDNPLSLLKDY